MSRPEMTEEYRPPMAPHVVGRYSKRTTDPDGVPDEQLWEAACERCGTTYGPAPCASGMVRQHISAFASSHVHRDALSDGFPERKR